MGVVGLEGVFLVPVLVGGEVVEEDSGVGLVVGVVEEEHLVLEEAVLDYGEVLGELEVDLSDVVLA